MTKQYKVARFVGRENGHNEGVKINYWVSSVGGRMVGSTIDSTAPFGDVPMTAHRFQSTTQDERVIRAVAPLRKKYVIESLEVIMVEEVTETREVVVGYGEVKG